MNKNPAIIIVSLVTGTLVSRTTFAQFALDNAEGYAPADLQRIGDDLTKDGKASTEGFLLIDITPTEEDVAAFMEAKAAELSEQLRGKYTHVRVSATQHSKEAGGTRDSEWTAYVGGDTHRRARTCAEAFAQALRECAPEILAERKRQEAHRLLAEAETIEGKQLAAA